MVDKVFDQILAQGVRAGKLPARQREARQWYRKKSQELQKPKQKKAINSASKGRKRHTASIGKLFFFFSMMPSGKRSFRIGTVYL